MLRTDLDGEVRSRVYAKIEQIQPRSNRYNANIAALNERLQRPEVNPEFLAHLAFNHCGESVIKLIREHPDLYNLNL